MKKMLSLLMALAMLFTCAFSAVAETAEDLDTLKAAEMEAMMEWLSTQVSEEEAEQVFTWDRDTILEKLEGYDQPLEYVTKEEAADQLVQVLSLFSLFSQAAEGENGGEAIMGLLGGLMGGASDDRTTGEESEDSEGLDSLLGLFGGLMGGTDEEGEGLEGLLGLFGSFMGSEEGFTGADYGEMDASYWADLTFDGTFWESGEAKMETVFQDGYYKILVTENDTQSVYLCEYEELEQDEQLLIRLNGIGTGDEERTAQQPDHGVTTFVYTPFDAALTWQRADGTELVFTQIIDPLDGIQYFNGANTLTIRWLGDLNYQVNIDNWVDYLSWSYDCLLDEEADVLTGTGSKSIILFGGEDFEDDTATFTFQNARNQLVWTSEKEEAAQSGLPFEHIEQDLMDAYWWNEEDYTVFIGWVTCYYLVQAYDAQENTYSYLCTYDRDESTFVSVDVAPIDFESINLYLEKDVFSNGGTFTLEDDDHLVWLDDAVTPGEGIVLERS